MERLAYSIPELAASVGVSADTVRREIRKGDLIPTYIGSRPVVTVEEAQRWLSSRLNERKSK